MGSTFWPDSPRFIDSSLNLELIISGGLTVSQPGRLLK